MQSNYIQLYTNMGHPHLNNSVMLKDDFYVLVTKNHKLSLRKKLSKNVCIIFNLEFIDKCYLCSDFARFCLALFKNNQHNDGGNMTMIPKQPIPISDELKEYIESFLPDYYDIRTN